MDASKAEAENILTILQMEPAVDLGALYAELDLPRTGCCGSACRCRSVVSLLQKNHSLIAGFLRDRSCFIVYHRLLTSIADALVGGKHHPTAQLGCAEAYYSLIACPIHSRRSRSSSSSSSSTGGSNSSSTAEQFTADDLDMAKTLAERLVRGQLTGVDLLDRQQHTWGKINAKLDKVTKALPAGTSTFTAANASKLSAWLTRNFDSTLSTALPNTHAFMIWTAALCRIWPGAIFKADLVQAALITAAFTAGRVLQAAAVMCRLQAAGITFTAQLPAATAAAAVELAALLLPELLSTYWEATMCTEPETHATGESDDMVVLPPAVGEVISSRLELMLVCNTLLSIYGRHLQQHLVSDAAGRAAVGGCEANLPIAASGSSSGSASSSSSGTSGNSSSMTSWHLSAALLLQMVDNMPSQSAQQQQQRLLSQVFLKVHLKEAQDAGYSAAWIDEIMTHLKQGLMSSYVTSTTSSSSNSSSGGSGSGRGGPSGTSSKTSSSEASGGGIGLPGSSTLSVPLCARAVNAAALLLCCALCPEAKLLQNPSIITERGLECMLPADTLCTQLLLAPQYVLSAFIAQLQLQGEAAVPEVQKQYTYLSDLLGHWDFVAGCYGRDHQKQQRPEAAALLQAWLAVLGQATHMLRLLLQMQMLPHNGTGSSSSSVRVSTSCNIGSISPAMLTAHQAVILQLVQQIGRHVRGLCTWVETGVISLPAGFLTQVHAQSAVAVSATEAAVRAFARCSGSSSSGGCSSSGGSSGQSGPTVEVTAGAYLMVSALTLFKSSILVTDPPEPCQPWMLETVGGQQLLQALCSLAMTACKVPGGCMPFFDVWTWFVVRVSKLAQPRAQHLPAGGPAAAVATASSLGASTAPSTVPSAQQQLVQLHLSSSSSSLTAARQQQQLGVSTAPSAAPSAQQQQQQQQLPSPGGAVAHRCVISFYSLICAVSGRLLCGCADQLQWVLSMRGASVVATLLAEQTRQSERPTQLSSLEGLLRHLEPLLRQMMLHLQGQADTAADGTPSSSSGSDANGVVTLTVSPAFREAFASAKAVALGCAGEMRAAHAGDCSLPPAAVRQFVLRLRELGELLCASLPGTFGCNNPGCTNVATASEAFVLVRGKACVCGGCAAERPGVGGPAPSEDQRCTLIREAATAARYCSAACQAAHWPQHSKVCGRLGSTTR